MKRRKKDERKRKKGGNLVFVTLETGAGRLVIIILGGEMSHPDTKRALFFEGSKKVFGSCAYVVMFFTSYLYA